MPYPLPPWIRPPENLAQDYLGGVRAGSEIQQEQARLNQQAQLSMMEAGLKQQQFAREHELEQQKIEIQKAYQSQTLAQRQQELQQQQELNQLKVQDAARNLQAMQQFQAWRQANPDRPAAEGILQFFPGTDTGAMTGYAQLQREVDQRNRIPVPDKVVQFMVEGKPVNFMEHTDRTGEVSHTRIPAGTADRSVERMNAASMRTLNSERTRLEKLINEDPFKVLADKVAANPDEEAKLTPEQKVRLASHRALEAQMQAVEGHIDSIYDNPDELWRPSRQAGTVAPAAPGAAAPAGPPRRKWDPATGKLSGGVPAAPPTPLAPPTEPGTIGFALTGRQIMQPPQQLPAPPPTSKWDEFSDQELLDKYHEINPGKYRMRDGVFIGPNFNPMRGLGGKLFQNDFQGNRQEMIQLLEKSGATAGEQEKKPVGSYSTEGSTWMLDEEEK